MGQNVCKAIDLRENKREVRQANKDQVAAIPGEKGVQDVSNTLGEPKDNSSKTRLVQVFLVRLCEQPRVHRQELRLTSQAGHGPDVADRLDCELKERIETQTGKLRKFFNLCRLLERLPLHR